MTANPDIHIGQLPEVNEVGMELRHWVLPGSNGEVIEFDGWFLGLGTSQRDSHNHTVLKCSACRWFEVRLFRERDSQGERDRFFVMRVGQSIMDNEVPLISTRWLITSREVIEYLTIYRPQANNMMIPTLSKAARHMLAQAAEFDDEMREAYDRRVTHSAA